MFENLKKAVIAESTKQAARVARYVMAADADALRARYATAKRWEQYTAGAISLETLRAYCVERERKAEGKRLAARLAKVDRIAAAAPASFITVDVDWKKSRVWGYNPHCSVRVFTADGFEGEYAGTASGCGYDKRSAATSDAFNKSPAILRALYDAEEKRLAETPEENRERAIGYGCGGAHSAIPYFEGGVGFSAHIHIFENIGLTCTERNERCATYDSYTFKAVQ